MVIYKYSTPHCVMCKAMSENLKKANLPYTIVEKDCDDEEVIKEAKALGIKGVPTIIIRDNDGKELTRWTHVLTVPQIIESIKNL